MIRALILLLLPIAAQADVLRVATFNTELSRSGPGLLLRDIDRGDAQVNAVVQVLTTTRPDIVALQSIDWDYDAQAVTALADLLRSAGLDYPHHFTAQPNAGLETVLDLDGDGRAQGPGDAQGWGHFTGQSGLAVLSRYPIHHEGAQDLSGILWKDVPGGELPTENGEPFPSKAARDIQRLSSVAHWILPIETPFGPFDLMTFHAAPPVFDGPEDRNGLRNRDEIRLWSLVMSGDIGTAPAGPFVIAGDANQDPRRGEGRKDAIEGLLNHPHLTDPQPRDPAGDMATVLWKGTGLMRVDYVLPSAEWTIVDAGVHWPDAGTAERDVATTASRHRLVWVDLQLD